MASQRCEKRPSTIFNLITTLWESKIYLIIDKNNNALLKYVILINRKFSGILSGINNEN